MAEAHNSGLQRMTYTLPADSGPRGIVRLGGTDILHAVVHVLAEGGRQGLHAHDNYDGLYLVLAGRARFYGEGGGLFAEVGPKEAVVVPRGQTYAFEAVGGPAEVFYVNAIDRQAEPGFHAREPGADAVNFDLFDPDGRLIAPAQTD